MLFNVFAGNMFCGTLTVTNNGHHLFRSTTGTLLSCTRLYHFKQLNLRKTKHWS